MALCSSLEQLVEVGKTLHEEAGLLDSLLTGPQPGSSSSSSPGEPAGGGSGGRAVGAQLVTTLCHQTALYCSKLLQVCVCVCVCVCVHDHN